MKKNEKNPAEDKFSYERRHEYIVKKMRTFTRRMGIKVKSIDRDLLPKGSYILTPNFTNVLAINSLYTSLGMDRPIVFVFDKKVGQKKFPGYAAASDSFYVD
jgi:hypothetical protein